MKNRRFDLRIKFILIIVLFLVLIFFAFSYSLVRSNTQALKNNLIEETKSFSELATPPIGEAYLTYKDSGRIRISQIIQKYADLNPNITSFSIFDTDGGVLFVQDDQIIETISEDQAVSFETVYIYNDEGHLDRVVVPYFEDSGVHRYSVVYDVSDESIQDSISRQFSLIVVFTIIGMLISIVILYAVVDYNFVQPMKSLSKQAQAVSAGDLDIQIVSDRHDEVADLAKAVNTMADKLKDDIKQLEALDELKSEFLIIVSHNLRTPLTIVRGYIDSADDVTNIKELKPILEKLRYGSKQLSVLAEDMITIAELESGQSIGKRKVIDVPEFIKDAAEDYVDQMKSEKIKFVEKIAKGKYQIEANESLMRGAIWSLLDNALKFTKSGGTVTLATHEDKETVTIIVKDTGIGMAEEEIPKLFTKFHRGTSLMTYDYEGTGIGLYSCGLVVEEHGGKIEATSELGKGSTFTITLPRVG